MRMKRECFAVLLIVILILHDPVISKAKNLERDMALWREQNAMYSLMNETVPDKVLDSLEGCHIQYYLNGGILSQINSYFYKNENLPVALETPTRPGYNFAGWYADSGYKQKVTQISEYGDYTLYAKWTKPIDGYHSIQMYSYQNKAVANARNKKLKNCNYEFLENVRIPGMPSTRETDITENKITDTSVCPQGICVTKEYYLVSAYTTNHNGTLGCIHVFHRESGEYLATLGMKKESHLGGITFDGESIWVCHSDNSTLECIPYSFVKRLCQKKPRKVVDCTAWFDAFEISNSPSCITFYDGKIWVATHTKVLNSVMMAYIPTKDGLKQVDSCRIPEKVQGVDFDEKGRVYLSTSYGRKNSSYLKVYDSLEHLNKKPNRPIAKVEMPPCSEEIAMEEDNIYMLFESASEKYFEGTDGRGSCLSPIDKILVVSKNSIFQ